MISSMPIPQPSPACAARNAALVASSCARHDSRVSPFRVLSLDAYSFLSFARHGEYTYAQTRVSAETGMVMKNAFRP